MSDHRPSRGTALLAALAALVAGSLVAVGYAGWSRASEFERATRLLPAETLRVTWTHWSALREELGADDVAGADREAFLSELEDRDLSASSLTSSADLLVEGLGLDPLASEWELLGQGREGMVLILKLAEDADVGATADRFADLGFERPGGDALSGAVWEGGPDVVSNVPGLATYELQNVAFVEDERLLLASDSARYLETAAVPVAAGEEDGLEAGTLVGAARDPLTAVGFLEDYACEALSMASADDETRAVADDLVDQAGGVTALTGYLVALEPESGISIVFDFEDDDRAERNERSRAGLAGAEDPAQFLSYPELFALEDVARDGHTVVLSGTVEPGLSPLSNLTQGPVLLASC